MNVLLVVLVAFVALISAGVIYQTLALARDVRRLRPTGTLLDIEGSRLHAVCRGSGTPAVVFEAAIAASSLSWSRVLPEVEQFARVCAYDRAGLGWSDTAALPRTLDRVIADLHAVISKTSERVPCILVGHSFGAFVCLVYASRYPQRVSGLVLVDPPNEWMRLDARQTYMLRGGMHLSRLGALLARAGVVRACLALLTGGAPGAPRAFVKVFGPTTARALERFVGEVRKLPADVHPFVQAAWSQPKCFSAAADYLRVFSEAVAALQASPPPDVPTTVISAGDQPRDVLEAHATLARGGRHVIAAKSGHWIQFDEPALVIGAIRELVEATRRGATTATAG